MKKSIILISTIAIIIVTYIGISFNTNKAEPFYDVTGTSKDQSVTYVMDETRADDNSLNIRFEFGPKNPTPDESSNEKYGTSHSFFFTFKNGTTEMSPSDVVFDMIIKNNGKEIDRLSKSYGNKPFITHSGQAELKYDFPLGEGTYPISFDIIMYDLAKDNKTLVQKTTAPIDDMLLTIKYL